MAGHPETQAGSEQATLWAGAEAERHGAQGETLMARPLKSNVTVSPYFKIYI